MGISGNKTEEEMLPVVEACGYYVPVHPFTEFLSVFQKARWARYER